MRFLPEDVSAEQYKATWHRFFLDKNEQDRERLILWNRKLVHYAFREIRGTEQIREDLIGYGMIGLIEAVDRFDPHQGNCFSSFAMFRIRGSMCDGLGKIEGLSRRAYRDKKLLERTEAEFCQTHDRPPTETELLNALGMSGKEYRAILHRISALPECGRNGRESGARSFGVFSSSFEEGAPETRASELCTPRNAVDEAVEERLLKESLHEAVERLHPLQKRILTEMLAGIPVSRISAEWGISRYKLKKMHENTIGCLRRDLMRNGGRNKRR